MSDIVNAAVATLNAKMAGKGFDGNAKIVLKDEGSIILDATGARASEEEAEVTLTASAETFQSILEGDTNPTVAFMTGKLSVDGNMGMAMKLASVLG